MMPVPSDSHDAIDGALAQSLIHGDDSHIPSDLENHFADGGVRRG
jgi:hypothetical protein